MGEVEYQTRQGSPRSFHADQLRIHGAFPLVCLSEGAILRARHRLHVARSAPMKIQLASLLASRPRRVAWLALGLSLAWVTGFTGCGGEQPAAKAPVDAGSAADAGSASKDVVKASCVGIASASRQLFSQYDDQCQFLKDCPTSGKCYCGAGCSETKTACAPELCADVDSDCWCGDSCGGQADKVQCPEYVCKDLQITGCEKQAGCTYVGQEMAAKCTCNTMPDTAPPCYCGDTCKAGKLKCPPANCVGKNPSKCLIVPGAKHTTPYCALCGLLGGEPKCFFVISP